MRENKAAIVIVCMNNLKNLLPCLDSIKEQTRIAYEVWVVAYLFSKDNLALLREKYPWVKVVESNEIRGFSENNNLALRQVKTEYTLVLNDDTLFKEPVLDELVKSMEKTQKADFMSPKLVYGDGRFQSCGKAPSTLVDFMLCIASLSNPNEKKSKYINQKGIFKTYNCTGACFLVKTKVLQALDYFDEYYFFMPEDLALSTLANKRGYNLYVDSNITLYHLQQQTGSKVKVATLPAARKGSIYFHSDGSKILYWLLALYVFSISLAKYIMFLIKGQKINAEAQLHCVETIFSNKTPKQIFIKYYTKLKK